MDKQKPLLRAISKAQAQRETAHNNYVNAIKAARAKHTIEEIGLAAGIGRSGVYYVLQDNPRRYRP